jgi:hypothetical protein
LLNFGNASKKETKMPVETIAAVASFVGLFFAWVVVPTVLKKRHATKAENQISE